MRFSSIFAFAALALSTAACGGDDGDSLTAGGFVNALADSICDKAYECMSTFPGDTTQFADAFGANRAACEDAQGFVPAADLQTAVDAGRVTFNASAGSMCVSGISAFTCEQFWSPSTPSPASCGMVLEGTVDTGGACSINAECISGSCNGTTCNAPS